MTATRREFIERLGATAMLGALPLSAMPEALRAFAPPEPVAPDDFDMTWTNKLKGKAHKALFDCTEIESGYGVWRAAMWEPQYHDTMHDQNTITVLVLRHNALPLAFTQAFWDEVKIGADAKVTHPITQQGTDRNPALLSSTRNEVPAMFDAFALPEFQKRGGIVLACNVALQFFSMGLAEKLKITPEDARKKAVAAFLPGITLQPSGVFACVRAQEAGCVYVKAS